MDGLVFSWSLLCYIITVFAAVCFVCATEILGICSAN